MDENSMYNTTTQLGFKNPFGSQMFPFYCLVEVASSREGPENAERLMELLEASESIIEVIGFRSNFYRMEWLHRMRTRRRKFGRLERRLHLLTSRKDM